MATGFGNYRNGNHSSRTPLNSTSKVSLNSNSKGSSIKSKSLNSSGLRKSAPASLGAAKDDAGGLVLFFLVKSLRSRAVFVVYILEIILL